MSQCTKGKPCGEACVAKGDSCHGSIDGEGPVAAGLNKIITAPPPPPPPPRRAPAPPPPPRRKEIPSLDTLELGEELGKGAYGRVNTVKGNEGFIVKTLIEGQEKNADSLAKEGEMQNIAAKAGLAEPCLSNEGMLVTKRLTGGDLAKESGYMRGPKMDKALQVRNDLILELHAKTGMSHNDTHLSNIMLDENGKHRLIDFGMARMGGTYPDFMTRVMLSDDNEMSEKTRKVVKEVKALQGRGEVTEEKYLEVARKHYG